MALKRLKVKHEFLHSGLITTGILAVATGIGFLFQSLGFTEENIIIVYVLGVLVIAAITANRGWSIFASVFSVLLFNFLFTVPRFSFAAYASGYPVTFVIAFLGRADREQSGDPVKTAGGDLSKDGGADTDAFGDESDLTESRRCG